MAVPPPPPRPEHKRTRPPSFDEQTKMGENPSQGKKPKASMKSLAEHMAPVKQTPPKEKETQGAKAPSSEDDVTAGRRVMYDSSSQSDDSEGYCALQEAHAINKQMTQQLITNREAGGQPQASSSTQRPPSPPPTQPQRWETVSRRQSAPRHSHYTTPWQLPSRAESSRISRPVAFSYWDMLDGRMNPNGHPSVYSDSRWGEDPSSLWNRAVLYLNSGTPLQLIREAAIIPIMCDPMHNVGW